MFVKADIDIFQNKVLVQTWSDRALVEKLTYTHWMKMADIFRTIKDAFSWLFDDSGWNDLHS